MANLKKGKIMSNPHVVDTHVGQRLRIRRNMLGITQGDLGEKVGLTFQQIQKYELGTNRISASRLFEISRVLSVPITFFFENIDLRDDPSVRPYDFHEENEDYGEESDPLKRRDTLELLQAFYAIQDEDVRTKMFDLVKILQTAVKPKAKRKDDSAIVQEQKHPWKRNKILDHC
jgi:transcriptional regulator with XRE-family HTH domain